MPRRNHGRYASQAFGKRIRALVTEGFNLMQIAKKLDVSTTTVRRALQFHYPQLFDNNRFLAAKTGRPKKDQTPKPDPTDNKISIVQNTTHHTLSQYKTVSTPSGFAKLFTESGESSPAAVYEKLAARGISKSEIDNAEAIAVLDYTLSQKRQSIESILHNLNNAHVDDYDDVSPEAVIIRNI